MERMLGPRRPFYKAGPVIRLERIPADQFAAFIDSRFQRSGVKPETGLGAAIVELAGNLPYDVQRLAHETWDEVRMGGRRRATLDDLHQALRRLLAEQHTLFEASWQRLTLPQRSVLRAVVLQEGRELLSAGTRERHRLGGASSVQHARPAGKTSSAVKADRYIVVDSLLREWVARDLLKLRKAPRGEMRRFQRESWLRIAADVDCVADAPCARQGTHPRRSDFVRERLALLGKTVFLLSFSFYVFLLLSLVLIGGASFLSVVRGPVAMGHLAGSSLMGLLWLLSRRPRCSVARLGAFDTRRRCLRLPGDHDGRGRQSDPQTSSPSR